MLIVPALPTSCERGLAARKHAMTVISSVAAAFSHAVGSQRGSIGARRR